jgi:hypothetical protein
MMEATRTSETLVNFYHTTRRYNPEDSHLWIRSVWKYNENYLYARRNEELRILHNKELRDLYRSQGSLRILILKSRGLWRAVHTRPCRTDILEFYPARPEDHLTCPTPSPEFTFKYVTSTPPKAEILLFQPEWNSTYLQSTLTTVTLICVSFNA